MKKVSTAAVKQSRNFSQPRLTIGLDLGDRSSWYCMLDGAGEVLVEQSSARLRKPCERGWGECHAVGSRWKRGCIRPGSVGC